MVVNQQLVDSVKESPLPITSTAKYRLSFKNQITTPHGGNNSILS